jgi:hypothetical protein
MQTEISVIFIGDNGWTDLASDLPAERETTARDFHKPWWTGVKLYHRNGYIYEVDKATTDQSLPPMSKLLAATFHNPQIVAQYEYRSTGFYQLADLKKAVHEAIYRNPDVLTQFHGADFLAARVAAAATFDDVVEVLRYAATEVEIVVEEDE